MKIEFVLDKNCLAVVTHIEMLNSIAEEFSSHEFILTLFESNQQRFKNLGIRLLPAWIIDNELLRINPGDYASIRKQILLRSRQEQDE